jgi:tRNA-guanine family transglycosylase
MRTYEYVISGPAYLRLGAEQCNDPAVLEMMLDMIGRVCHNQNNHNFSLLYNGFTEKNFGPKLQKFRPSIKNIHADSGGLQIITRGLKNTPEVREKVYLNQGTYADIGMAFDEIPVKTTSTSGVSSKIDTKRRYADMDNFDEYARQTGRNVKSQIETFDRMGSNCRPFVIMQGSSQESYSRWAELVLEEITPALHHRIGGLAMGSAALGMGQLEDVKRAFYVTQMPYTRPFHLHVLGVGALRRILPYICFSQSGLYEGIDISYDSTTHSMSLDNGLFYFSFSKKVAGSPYGGTSVKMGREYSNIYRTVTEEINTVCGTNYTPEEYHILMNRGVGVHLEAGGQFVDIMRARLAFILTNVHNFTKDVNALTESKELFLKFCREKDCENEYATLFDVKTLTDFEHWEKNVGKYMESEPVNTQPPVSLEDLFA